MAAGGITVDRVQALMWLDIAQGGPGPNHAIFERPYNPATARSHLAAQMTPEEVEEADRRASAWIAKHEKPSIPNP